MSHITPKSVYQEGILIHLHTHNRKYTTIVKTNMSIIRNNVSVDYINGLII